MTTIYVSNEGGEKNHNGQTVMTVPLAEGLDRATPGDVVRLVSDRYTRPATIRRPGVSGRPVTIEGGPGVILDGEQSPAEPVGRRKPRPEDFAFFKLDRVDWITLKGLGFRGCWPSAVYLADSADVVLHELTVEGGTFAFFARGPGCANLTVEDCGWTQDPSGRIWTEHDWWEVKYGAYRYFLGALFGSFDIRGDVIIRRNHVKYAFNGIRMDAESADLSLHRNLNVQIYENTFEYVRDNPIEPEKTGVNWWIHHNRIRNGHAWFSLHEVSGGHWYIFGNVGWFDDIPGLPGQGHRNGQVLKYVRQDPYPTLPVHIFNNSWYVRTSYAKKGTTRLLRHHNNAIHYCFSDGAGLACDRRRAFFGAGEDAFDTSFSHEFRNDWCNHPDFPEGLRRQGYQQIHGTHQARLGFEDPRHGFFRLRPDSPLIGRGVPVRVELPHDESWQAKAPFDVGAMNGADPFPGPAFVRYQP